jgi:hypothetical protein
MMTTSRWWAQVVDGRQWVEVLAADDDVDEQ